ncbi:protein of unknown function [Anaerovirgula multivorans]|uniref:DUF1835 domain-containing protein n=1 Tax=Anaerovirgula multivorans TaxID=312168 RepID=A0A239GXX1_9FIRM|nr:DUF3658 domain-containing protein [Anaerovirgula multivorans]SNS73977.1 protein of unknown function [Anaerovirgula multivorans]
MIEVMFGESEGGAMKMAKNYQKPDFNNGTTAWFGKKPTKDEFDKMFDGKAVGGNSSEVLCIPFMLDIGDINVPIESEYRKKLILDMYTINGWDDKSTLEDLEKAWKKYLDEIGRLKNYAAQGKNIRLWYSDAPYSMCGFYYVCNLLREYGCKVSAIKLPQYMQISDNEIQFYTSWGEIDAGKFYKFLPLEKELSSCEMRSFVLDWVELKEEKSNLRAVVNGKVIGVPEDFYDHIIRKEIPDGEFIMARLIGNILGKHPLGIGDWWYAKRINKMIEQGELVVVQKQKEIYRQVLKKV